MAMSSSLLDGLDPKAVFRFLGGAVLLTLAIGTVFYHYVEGFTWIDSYYFSVVTLATVGYGDLAPRTIAGKLFTTFYIFAGVGMLATFFSFLVKMRAAKRIMSMEEHNKEHQEPT